MNNYPPAVVMIGIGLLAIFVASGATELFDILALGAGGVGLLAMGVRRLDTEDEP